MRKNSSSWQLGSSLAAILLFGLVASCCALTGFIQLWSRVPGVSVAPMFLFMGGLLFVGLLLLPSAWYAWKRIKDGQAAPWPVLSSQKKIGIALALSGILPLVLLAGNWAAKTATLDWLLLPFLHVLAVSIPVFGLVWAFTRGLPVGSPQRFWGILGAGVALGPVLIIILEMIAMGILGLLGVFYIAGQPEWVDALNLMAERLQQGAANPQWLMDNLAPIISQPVILMGVFVLVAILVPLIEEILKPIGVWLLAGRGLSPAEGFAAGVISGAGYAIFESLFLAASQDGWVTLVVVRIATGVLHMCTTGLMGWGLAQAWGQRKWQYLTIAFIGAVSLHALWNGMTLLTVAASLPAISLPEWSKTALNVLPTAVLVGLFLLSLSLLAGFSISLKHAIITPVLEQDASASVEPGTSEDLPAASSDDAPSTDDETPAGEA